MKPDDSLPLSSEYQLDFFDWNQATIPFPKRKTIGQLCSITFEDGRRVYRHQAENVKFFEDNNFRGICADDTGLGKTITACALVHEHRDKLLPVLVVCKTTLKYQWWVEFVKTCDLVLEVIGNNNAPINADADGWIISYDMLKRIWDLGDEIKPKFLILDECQAIKNWESARTKAMVEFAKNVPYIIGTSADPIKNHAFEYYPMMHIVHPGRSPFNVRAEFERWCEFVPTTSGTWRRGGIDDRYLAQWQKVTSDVIIRHKREDEMPDLPKVRRSHRYVKIEEEGARFLLNKALIEFVEAYDAHKADTSTNTFASRRSASGSLMKLRHEIGNAKISHALDFIEEFLNEGDVTRKLTIFVHHKTVAEAILLGIQRLRDTGKITCNTPFVIRGGMNEDERNRLVMACTRNSGWPTDDPFDRLLIGSTLAAGEGINLQKCFDCLMVERQFNPPNEEQAFGRFSRIGIATGVKNIFATYLTAMSTLDDWFDKLVEGKRETLRKTHGDKENYGSEWGEEDEIVTDLMDYAAEQGRKLIKKIKRQNRAAKGE